jgi:hypothetical protein
MSEINITNPDVSTSGIMKYLDQFKYFIRGNDHIAKLVKIIALAIGHVVAIIVFYVCVVQHPSYPKPIEVFFGSISIISLILMGMYDVCNLYDLGSKVYSKVITWWYK